jgi:uncharacterized DUF497 family protein
VIDFEWDINKADINVRKHGVSFEEARTVFSDPFELTISDPDHSIGEHRFLSIGRSEHNRIIVVSYTERQLNVIRIISTRVASKHERQHYESKHVR